MKQRGFTLIELVVTMIIVGIMAVTVLPRFVALGTFDAAGYADQSASLLRYAQKTAIAQRRWTTVDVAANPPICSQTYTFPAFPTCAANCAGGANVAAITLSGGEPRGPQASTTLAGSSVLCFDAVGQPFAVGTAVPLAAAVTLNILDNGTVLRTLTVEAATGYVHF